MTLSYKKVGVDISKIKKSQAEIGRIIASTHKLQKKVKNCSRFWPLRRNRRNTWKSSASDTH